MIRRGRVFVLAALLVALSGPAWSADTTLAKVNQQPVTAGMVELERLIRGVPDDRAADVQKSIAEQLVEQQLVQEFLTRRKIEAPKADVEARGFQIGKKLEKAGHPLEATAGKLGLSKEQVVRHVAFPLAWQMYVREVVTTETLKRRFEANPMRYDGTRLRARQIFLPAKDDAARKEAEARLGDVRREIAAGTITFEEAARKYSQAPTAAAGGDVGFFGVQGRLPKSVVDAAFGMKKGEVSAPVVSPFGVHLLTVTDVQPGQLSLEDSRPQLYQELAAELWMKTLEAERAKAKVEWVAK